MICVDVAGCQLAPPCLLRGMRNGRWICEDAAAPAEAARTRPGKYGKEEVVGIIGEHLVQV